MLFLFQSTRDVIAAEKIIRAKKIDCQIIPVPRYISSECGMGIRIDASREDAAYNLLVNFHPERYSE